MHTTPFWFLSALCTAETLLLAQDWGCVAGWEEGREQGGPPSLDPTDRVQGELSSAGAAGWDSSSQVLTSVSWLWALPGRGCHPPPTPGQCCALEPRWSLVDAAPGTSSGRGVL